jgi:hypothetical protein
MTPYQSAIELAIGMARVTTREQVKVVTWLPFQVLYSEMIKAGDMEPIIKMDRERALKYWAEAKEAQPGKPKWKQIAIWQSLYMYDQIIKTI